MFEKDTGACSIYVLFYLFAADVFKPFSKSLKNFGFGK